MYNGMQVKNRLLARITAFLGSRRFWYGVLIFFVLESLWVAFSARYPMAFDEDFHLGVIRIYSQQWLPFLTEQPAGANQFGALQSDPSYLYHYLMSFPYRLMTVITDNQTAQVIVLRLLNIPLVLGALLLFKQLCLRAGASVPFAHTALALFVLIPIMPLLSGQINYDNLVLLLMAWMCLLAFDVYTALRRQHIDVQALTALALVCLGTSLVKYAFLPMVVVTVAFVLVGVWQGFYGRGWRVLRQAVIAGYRRIAKRTVIVLAVLVILLGGLFMQRYGVNMVRYHTPVPSCEVVLDTTACRAYGPWVRNHDLTKAKGDTPAAWSPLAYTWHWVQALHYRLFFTVNGPYDSFRNYPPMPLPAATTVILAVSGVVALALYGRRIFAGQPFLAYMAGLVLFYALVLWVEDYSQFVETGQPVAINGRYLLPVIIPAALVLGRALRLALAYTPRVKPAAAALVLLLFLQGGGVTSFILRSDAVWYWENSTVWHANNAAQHVLRPVIIEGSKYYQ
jgi:hypothetical protein